MSMDIPAGANPGELVAAYRKARARSDEIVRERIDGATELRAEDAN